MGRLRHNLTRLATGSVMAQIILSASTPLLTRLFAPASFGVAAIFNAAYALLIPLVTLKYDQAIILPKSHRSAAPIGALVMLIATASSLLVGLGMLAWQYLFRDRFEFSLLLLPVALWLGAAYTLMQQWSSRVSDYTHFARSQTVGAIANVSICVIFAMAISPRSLFMVLGITAGIGVALIYTILGFKEWPYRIHSMRYRAIQRQLKVYSNFPKFVLPTALLTIAGTSGVPFVLSHYYSLGEVGIFAVANRVLLIPAAIIGGALAEAIRSEFAARQRMREPVSPLFSKLFTPIMALSVVSFGAIFFAPSSLFEFAFGRQYVASSVVAQSLLLATLSQFVCAPFMYVFAILRRPAKGLLGQVLISLFPLGALIAVSQQGSSMGDALLIYSLCTLGGALIMLALIYRGCKAFDGGN